MLIQPFGSSDFSFCAVGDTVVYKYNMANNSLNVIFSYPNPIADFKVDDEDVFFASGNQVMAFLTEKYYIPIFQSELPVLNIAFCGQESLFFSDESGLWLVDKKRNKISILDQPVLEIITDSNMQGFFKMMDGSWLFVHPITNYMSTELK